MATPPAVGGVLSEAVVRSPWWSRRSTTDGGEQLDPGSGRARLGSGPRVIVASVACLLWAGLPTPAVLADEVAAGGDAPGWGSRPESGRGSGATEATTPRSDLGHGSVRDQWPGPGAPRIPTPAPDRVAVVRGPVFVRGDARSGDSLIAASRGRTCAVRRSGTVTCWGQDGIRERLSAASLKNVVSIRTGDHPHQEIHVCALHGDGTVSCWGPVAPASWGGARSSAATSPRKCRGSPTP